MPPWALGFINIIHAFRSGQEIDRKTTTYIVAEAKGNKKDEEQDDHALRALVEF